MRYTSKRRTTMGHAQKIGGVVTVRKTAVRADLTVPEGTPNSVVCVVCEARLPRLANGHPKSHAAGGTRPRIAQGEYRCEGSGSF